MSELTDKQQKKIQDRIAKWKGNNVLGKSGVWYLIWRNDEGKQYLSED